MKTRTNIPFQDKQARNAVVSRRRQNKKQHKHDSGQSQSFENQQERNDVVSRRRPNKKQQKKTAAANLKALKIIINK